MIDTETFLKAVFGEDAPYVYITDFTFDPNDIPAGEHMRAWSGDYAYRYTLHDGTNQYFCISVFKPDEHGRARRRKSLFLRCSVIVLDDVKEKLPMSEVNKLPLPSYIIETSDGSEQWGYILNEPCCDRKRVENLLDGLVANGLAPGGKDPGMKGVTRFIRVPGGYNTKASKANPDGTPWKVRITDWHPERKVTMEQLAAPFDVDLHAARRDARVDGASLVPGHPLLDAGLIIKSELSPGRYDITCPWVDDHTGSIDNGTAIFTNEDGSIGFKCHHGACQSRTGRDLIQSIEKNAPGFDETYRTWNLIRMFSDVVEPSKDDTTVVEVVDPMDAGLEQLSHAEPGSPTQIELANKCLKAVSMCPPARQPGLYKQVRVLMQWSAAELVKVLRGVNEHSTVDLSELFKQFIYVKSMNRFYESRTGTFYKTEGFRNSHADYDSEVLTMGITGGVEKVDKIEFAPEMPQTFMRGNVSYGNTWERILETGSHGDCSQWLNHFNVLGWSEYRDHVMQWMAFTIRHPGQKINHGLMLAGAEGVGKDFILEPLRRFMNGQYKSIEGSKLASEFNDYLWGTKYLNINETDVGDHKEARKIGNLLKPLLANPPDTLQVNAKGIPAIDVLNIVNVTMTTNSDHPVFQTEVSRRLMALRTDVTITDSNRDQWVAYWNYCWDWMHNGGSAHCIDYLLNEVDISNFDPGKAPPVTDFLRDMANQSKTLLQVTIEDLVAAGVGPFSHNEMTTAEIVDGIKLCALTGDSMVCVDLSRVNKITVGRVMRKAGAVPIRSNQVNGWKLR